jgi:hypothetical protein
MNERIQELKQQANEYTNSRVDGPSPIWFECFNEKFAELIVQECMGFCKEVESDMDGLPTEEMRDIGSMGAKFCYEQIKEYFGVEE